MEEPGAGYSPWARKELDTTEQLHFHFNLCKGFHGVLVVKNLPASAGDVSSASGLGTYPGDGNGNAPQYSCRGYPRDRGA